MNSSQQAVPIGAVSGAPINTTRQLAIFLLISDLCSIILLWVLTYFLRIGRTPDLLSPALSGTVILVLLVFYIVDAYRPDLQVAGLGAPTRTLVGCIFAGVALSALSYLYRATALTPLLWRSVFLPGLGFFTLWAVLVRVIVGTWARSHAKQSVCLLLGSDANTQRFEQDFKKWNPFGKLVVLADADPAIGGSAPHAHSVAGSLSDLTAWATQPWSGVIVAPQIELSDQQVQSLMQLRLKGIPVYQLPNFYERLWQKLPPALLQDIWFTFGDGFELFADRITLKIKRLVDIVTASLLLASLSPLMLLAGIAVKLESPGAIFYSQLRNGLHGQPFRVYKFRSMRQDAEKAGAQWAQKRDPRITRVGYCLRLMRIDELPQLWNVLRGEMSLIGPRPERPEFDSQLTTQIPYYKLRYLVKPGITGWAQVMYPYGASVEDAYEKLSYDLYYIKNYSIWLDLAIAFKTVRVVILGKGQ